MKLQTLIASVFTLAMVALTTVSFAQNPTTTATPRKAGNGELNVGNLDKVTAGATFRASQLMGYNIQNDERKNVGEIKDLVLDAQTGRIRYVAVTYGGFLGVGNKLFAVPFEAFKVRQNPDDPTHAGDFVLVLNVTQAQLKGAVGFDHDHWPNMADPSFAHDLHSRYGTTPATHDQSVERK